MEFRTLGRTGLSVSLVSFGTGGPSGFGAPEAAERPQRAALVHRCLEHGINLFDTSENYGESEALLGEALAGVPRDRYLLLTKWPPSPRWSAAGVGGSDAPIQTDPEALTRAVEASLRRLRTDVIDVMELHGVRPEQYEEVAERFIPVLDRLRREGKIRHRGISERYIVDPRHEAVSLALERHPDSWDVISLKYGILNQFAAKRALPLARRHGAGVVCMSAVRSKLSQQPQLRALIAELKRDGAIAADALDDDDPLGWLVVGSVDSVITAGYRFAARHPDIHTVLTGTTNLQHLDANVACMETLELPEEHAARLRSVFGDLAVWA